MKTDRHYTVTDADADAYWFLGTMAKIKASAEQTGGALSMIEFTHPAGFATPPHVHSQSDEAFYVLEGNIAGFCGDVQWSAGPGDLIWLPKGVPHGYRVVGPEQLRTLAINLPAGFEQFVAESGTPADQASAAPTIAIDPAVLDAAAARVGIQHLGPPPITEA